MSARPLPDAPLGAGVSVPVAGFGFVALMAALGALNAVATDIVIPVLDEISADLAVEEANRRQWVIYAVFVGMALSQLLVGPIADRHGRRTAVFLGLGTYLAGAALSAAAPSFEVLLAGRALQGLGSGGMRVMTLAITRDRFAGDEMSRIVSLTTAVFVLMVLCGPFLGEYIARLGSWRWVFAWLALQGVATGLWFAFAQPETLRPEHRRPLRVGPVLVTLGEVLRDPGVARCALALAASFGAFAAYLGSAQQILGGIYGLEGTALPAAFGVLALAYGAASLLNAAAVRRRGADRLARDGLLIWLFVAGLGAGMSHELFGGVPPLWLTLLMFGLTVGFFALLYGNLQALALMRMGDRAGSASSAVSAIASLGGVVAAGLSGAAFDGTVVPLLLTFAAAGAIGLVALGPASDRR